MKGALAVTITPSPVPNAWNADAHRPNGSVYLSCYGQLPAVLAAVQASLDEWNRRAS